MAIEKRWINWASAITGAILLMFTLAQLVISFYMNLTTKINKQEKVNISGAELVSMAVLYFPTSWVAFASAISRHAGVYITFLVMGALSFLDAVGMIVYQTIRFSQTAGYTDMEKDIAITMCALQAAIIIILILCLAFAITALCYRSNTGKHKEKYGPSYPTIYSQSPPTYNTYDGYRMSLPKPAWDHSLEPRHVTEPRSYYYGKARF